MSDSWFPLYQFYSTKKSFDRKGLKRFEEDVERAERLGVKKIVIEGYYRGVQMGDYTDYVNLKTFKEMVRVAHDHGMEVFPYFCAVELYSNNSVFGKHAEEWSAKNFLGIPYHGFISFFLPEYFEGVNSYSQIMCPGTGWREHLVSQVREVVSDVGADGVYLDRTDYRLTCHDDSHEHGGKSFNELLLGLVKDLSRVGRLFMNDSCIKPDEHFRKYFRYADEVLSEVLPYDSNAWPLNFFKNQASFFIWKARRLAHPLSRRSYYSSFFLKNKRFISDDRFDEVINRLKKFVGGKNIHVALHRKDEQGVRAVRRAKERLGVKACYLCGMKDLSFVEKYFKPQLKD